jgi:hypothetical protein
MSKSAVVKPRSFAITPVAFGRLAVLHEPVSRILSIRLPFSELYSASGEFERQLWESQVGPFSMFDVGLRSNVFAYNIDLGNRDIHVNRHNAI